MKSQGAYLSRESKLDSNTALVLIEVDACFSGHGFETLLFQGFEGFGGDAEADEAFALGPPDALVLKVGFLEALGAAVGVGDGKGVIGFFASEVALLRHCFLC